MNRTHSTFVINLEHRVDRRTEMQRELLRIGWSATFFPAIKPSSAGDFTSTGARGCFLSHLAVLKEAKAASVERLVILEDDVNFVRDFSDRWQSVLAELDASNWSVFYPGHALKEMSAGLSLLKPEASVLCAHFMMINNHAISTIIEGLEMISQRPAGHPLGGPMHVDGAYSTIRAQNPGLRTYALSPVLGYQRPSRTDIRNTKWYDRPGPLERLVSVARRIKASRIN